MSNDNIDPRQILQTAKRILLIDWPNIVVPRTLVSAGFTVFCYSPDQYSKAEVVAEYPADVNQKNIFPPRNKHEGFLVIKPLNGLPESVDIVNVYRPEEEHAAIIKNQALPLKAKIFWLHPPASSEKTKALAQANGLIYIEHNDIAELAMR
jgi:predicted CoA-binding protein